MAADFPLSGRVAIVTGASRGIGRAIALHFASLGASVVLSYTSSSSEADRLAAEINSSSPTPRAVAIPADVTDPSAVRSLFDLAEKAFSSPPHIVVHSAGILDPNYPHIASTPLADFDRAMAVNARGAFIVLQEAANRVLRGGGGRIIALSTSVLGLNLPGYGAYSASKAAVEAMVRILSKEMKGTGVTVNCVAPGPVESELFFAGKSEEDVKRAANLNPMGRVGLPEDIGPVVGFLCSDAGQWVNGQVVRVNGGMI
ncbi:hypothetical protein HPP92_001661 [Vanilla planifolia]|uniref:Noroxomaritidine/norcraugsodine reductase n=1 Tax=Vanilla planifolia TaxID=51239 RepID=A0A835VHD8_VANPL|nr:hypothetical protein HPP92_001904 [Vanilla planifolia]KAG0501589.1 hypothetical protein HPP92_001661 [Vanilla planifolia]